MTPRVGRGCAGMRKMWLQSLPAAILHAAGSAFHDPGNNQSPTPERHWPHTLVNFCFLLIFTFSLYQGEAMLHWSLFRTFIPPGWLLGGRESFFS